MGRGPTERRSTGRRRSRTDRRTFLRIAGSGAIATAIAGCSDTAEPTASDTDSSGNETDDGEPSDDTGVVKIGHLAPLELPIGLGSQRSADVAVAELNENGGVLDSRVRLVLVRRGRRPDPKGPAATTRLRWKPPVVSFTRTTSMSSSRRVRRRWPAESSISPPRTTFRVFSPERDRRRSSRKQSARRTTGTETSSERGRSTATSRPN